MYNPTIGVGIGACVHYQISVLDSRTGKTVCELPRKRNLILDQGLDLVATTARWCQLFEYAAVGTGTTPVKRDSGTVTFTRAGNAVYASAGFFQAGDVGRLLKWDTGEEAYINSFIDAQNVTTVSSGAIAAAQGTVWYVNQVGLTTETKRTNTYGTDSGDNGSTYSLGSIINKRTFIFSAEAGPIVYNELGWSYTNGAGNNLFGRDLISGGVALVAGQQLKVVVTLTLTISPQTPQAYVNVVTGWTKNGNFCAEDVSQNFARACTYVDNPGGGTGGAGGTQIVFEPFCDKTMSLASDATALVAQQYVNLTFAGGLGTKTLTKDAYTPGSFTRTFTGTFAVSEGNATTIRSLVVTAGATNERTFRVLLDANETKDSSHTLTFSFRLTWGRTLVN